MNPSSTQGKYARQTKVSAHQSEANIKDLLVKYGCKKFAVAYDETEVTLGFVLEGELHRITLPLPSAAEPITAVVRNQNINSRWRALLLMLKGRLEFAEITRQPLTHALGDLRVQSGGQTLNELLALPGPNPLS